MLRMAEATLQLPTFFYVRLLKCYDCEHRIGRCLKGRLNVIAVSEACESFKPKVERRVLHGLFPSPKRGLTRW
jgi:hypothetical protein